MSRQKKPVIIVAIVLGALIIVPLALLVFTRSGAPGASGMGDAPPVDPGKVTSGGVLDFDLRQLAEKAEQLLEGPLADALRAGDVSLDFVSFMQKQASEAASDARKGRGADAAKLYSSIITAVEAKLAAIALADQARAQSETSYAELQRLEYLKGFYENSYEEAVETYNNGLQAIQSGAFQDALDAFEMVNALLGDLEARAIQLKASLIDAGEEALAQYKLETARKAFTEALSLDAANAEATAGLASVESLEGIIDEVKAIMELEAAGDLEAALSGLKTLAETHPENAFIEQQIASLEESLAEREFKSLVDDSLVDEAAGNIDAAISKLEAALKIRNDPEQAARLSKLKEQAKAARLEILLANGFSALKAGRYESARNSYREAVALAPESKEARTGLEKASSLYLADIRYSQNIAATEKLIAEGRYPLAANRFNEAMGSRPSRISEEKQNKEDAIRTTLEAQSEEVSVTIRSDSRTYVSIIGVLPPDRFRKTELNLFPDVYKLRGTRSGYAPVEIEFKVDATQPDPTITVICSDRI